MFNIKKFKKIFLIFATSLSFSLFADDVAIHELSFKPYPAPWFTGPLITPSGYTVRPGHCNVEPFVFAICDIGRYNSHWHSSRLDTFYSLRMGSSIKVGFAKILELHVVPTIVYQEKLGQHSFNVSDMLVEIEAQLLRHQKLSPIPAIKLALRTNIPMGKYEHLNPMKEKTDATGTGCWFPGVRLSFVKFFHITGSHFMELRWYSDYLIGTPTFVKGFNTYGGDAKTRGWEYPGNRLVLGASIQYNLTQRWAVACDARYAHENKDRFSGRTLTPMKRPSSEEYSLAPAIEYNWSSNIGMIAGVWFSFAGRNAPEFVSGAWKLNIYF